MRRSYSGVALSGLLLWGLSSQLAGQTVPEQVAQANQLYREGKFDQAKKEYLEALKRRPELPELHFNLGDALYKSEEYEDARESFKESLREAPRELQSNAWYNLGNALFRQGELQESLEAFKESLRLNPADVDAKHNLEYVLKQMQEQPQQDQSSDDQQQQEEQDQQEQSQDQSQGEEPSQSQQEESQPESEQNEQQPQSGSESEAPPNPADEPPPPQSAETNSAQQMSLEDVQRILDALKEDPEKFLKRKVVRPVRLKVKKDW